MQERVLHKFFEELDTFHIFEFFRPLNSINHQVTYFCSSW